MQRLWISNIAPGTSDEELKGLVEKYAPDLECFEILRVDGNGNRPAAILSFLHRKLASLEDLSAQLNGMYWKGRTLWVATTLT